MVNLCIAEKRINNYLELAQNVHYNKQLNKGDKMRIDSEHATNEAALLINNDEFLYNVFKEIRTIDGLSKYFTALIAPKIRSGIDVHCYSIHDINLNELLERIDTNINKGE